VAFRLAELFVDITGRDSHVNSVLGRVHNRVSASTIALGTAAGNLLTGAVRGVGNMMGGIIDTTMNLEDQMVALAKATDQSPENLAKMKEELYALSTTLKGVPLENLLDIATSGAKMGVSNNELLTYVEGIAKVSTAMDDVPAQTVADSLGKINAVFGLGVNGAMQLGSAIDKIGDSGIATNSAIMEVTQRISGTMKAAGLTAQETIALAGALLDTGTNSEAAAGAITRMTMAFSKEENPRQAMLAFLEKIRTMSLGDAVKALEGVGLSADITQGEIVKLATQFGSIGKYTGFANEQFLTLAQANMSYAMSAGTSRAAMTQLGNQIKIAGEAIGTAFLPVFTALQPAVAALAKGLSPLFKDIGASITANMPQIEAFGAKLATVGPIIAGAWRELPLTINLVGSVIQDVFANALTIAQNILVGFAKFAIDLFGQIADIIGAKIHNGIAGSVQGFGRGFIQGLTGGVVDIGGMSEVTVPSLKPNLGAFGNVLAGTGLSEGTKDKALALQAAQLKVQQEQLSEQKKANAKGPVPAVAS
jgi:TP901 family phage tail tape measure protein